jgi:hypothetical protein
MTDFRALCAELVELDQAEPGDYPEWRQSWNAAVARARTALAQPEPAGPTDEELISCMIEAATLTPMGKSFEILEWPDEAVALACAVLARWGRPAITPIPVSERLPGAEDCDAEGCCWWWIVDQPGQFPYWIYAPDEAVAWAGYQSWLPHWALPLPHKTNT